MSQVAILGCGPAGLIAAWAVESLGHEPRIFSRKQKSTIPGSQYLHAPIPGLSGVYPEGTVQYVRLGTAEGYSRKVYGDVRETGWGNYLAVYPSWNVMKTYDKLWSHYRDQIVDTDITKQVVHGMVTAQTYGRIISTIPHSQLCLKPDHRFDGSPYWIKTLPTPPQDAEHDLVVYNGLESDPWYRWSILGGVCSIEYATHPRDLDGDIWSEALRTAVGDPEVGYTRGIKATTNSCDCWPTVVRAGRWAEWRHGVLLHNVYHTAREAVITL